MNRDIDYFEYERRKAKIQNIGLRSWEYDAAINRIVKALESDADRAEAHESKITIAVCPSCGAKGTLEPIAGYFDPRLVGVSASDPRKYEEGWNCAACQGKFAESDIVSVAA